MKKITRKSSGDKYVTVYIDGIFEHSYHLDGSNAMDEELNELHVMDDQTRVAMLRTGYDDGTPTTKYILSDHLGSSNVILETSGAVYNREEYYPFGELRSNRERLKKSKHFVSQTSFGAFGKKRYRYVGKEKDEESGLYYYGARYYQPWSCRFISVDPLAAKYAHLSPYNYASNNPITHLDVDGMQNPAEGNSPQGGDTTSTVQQAQSETKKPPTSPLPEQGNDYFDEQGNYIKTVKNDKNENNIYILNKDGKETLLSAYKFNKNNASILANITKHYAQYAGVDTTKLLNSSFSVAMKQETPIYGEDGKRMNLNDTRSVSLFNNGSADTNLGSNAIMTSDWKGKDKTEKVITVQVDTYGFTNKLLANKFNFINNLYHEGLHKKGDSSSEFNHLNIYIKQVQHASWKYTTEAQKLNVVSNVKQTIADAKSWNGSRGQSQSDIKLIREGGTSYENKFKMLLPTYFK